MKSVNGLELIGSFLVVAEELNFRRSAERLNLDQSALSRRIQKLEGFLGFRLLERSTREVALTAAGQSFYHDNSALMDGYRGSIAAARRVAEGHTDGLRIGYMTFAARVQMPQLVRRFHDRHPYVRLDMTYLRTQAQKLALAKGEIDLGFMIDQFDHPDFDRIPLTDEALYVILPDSHPLAKAQDLAPADLIGEPLVLGQMQEWDEFRWRLEDMFSAEGVALTPHVEAAHTLALAGLVAAGLGVTIFPESLLGVLGPGLTARPIRHPAFRMRTALFWLRTNRSRELADFLSLVPQTPGAPDRMVG